MSGSSSFLNALFVMQMGGALKTSGFIQDMVFGLLDPATEERAAMLGEHVHDPIGHVVRAARVRRRRGP